MAVAGERIGAYEVVRLIAHGGMATVYEARQPALDRVVALKRLDLRTDDPTLVDRFIHESRIAASFDHPNIVTVFDFFEAEGVPYIAMEYLPRGSLRPWIGRLSEPQVFGILEGILAGLAHAEEHGVAHRDLKPENVLVARNGAVKIGDFGIAKAYTRTTGRFTAAGAAVGTPAYMAPEQALAHEVGPYTDLYALGVVAFEMLSGAPPFDGGETPVTVMYRHVSEKPPLLAGVDPRLAGWVGCLLEKAPEARPAGAAEAWDALEEIIVDEHGPYWRRKAGLAAGEATPGRPALATAMSAARATAESPPQRREAVAESPTEVLPARDRKDEPDRAPSHRRRRGAVAAAAGIAGLGAVAGVVLIGSDREPSPRAGPAVKAAAAFDFDGDRRATPVAGRPGAGRGGMVVIGSQRLSSAEPQPGEEFGAAIASADFDRDGFADLAIGAPGHDSGGRARVEGAVTTLYGSPSGLDRRETVTGPGSRFPFRSARFGAALAAGDVNADGYADLVIGVPGGDALFEEDEGSGTLRLLFGGRDGLGDDGRTLLRPRASLGRFGSVVAVGDVNGDDRDDLIVASPGAPAASVLGHASYCESDGDGPRKCRTLATLEGGPAALAVGDVTGDGLGDIVAGVPLNAYSDDAATAGAVVIWRGTRQGPRARAVTVTQQTDNVGGHDQARDRFGAAIAVADLDGDSYADIVVGAPGEDEAAGRVIVVRGSRNAQPNVAGPGYSQATPGVPGSLTAGHQFGAAVALLDADGDGRRPDLLVTAPGAARSLFTLVGERGGFTGSGASARLPGGQVSLGVG